MPSDSPDFSKLPNGETTRQFRALGADDGQDPVEVDESPALESIDGLPEDTALLVVKRGPNAGSRFLLDEAVTTVGRHPDSDIFLDDITVSRKHVEFRREGGTFTVHDVGSLNGTYLNRELIDHAQLASGDEVQIGKFRLTFLIGHRASAGSTGSTGDPEGAPQ